MRKRLLFIALIGMLVCLFMGSHVYAQAFRLPLTLVSAWGDQLRGCERPRRHRSGRNASCHAGVLS